MDRQLLRDRGTHGGADHVRAFDADGIEQADRVGRHVMQSVGRLDRLPDKRIFQELRQRRRLAIHLSRFADVAIVEADDVESALRQSRAKPLIPQDHLRAKAHDEEEWPVVAITERVVAKFDAVRLHDLFRGMSDFLRQCIGQARSSQAYKQTKARARRAFEYSGTTFADYAARG